MARKISACGPDSSQNELNYISARSSLYVPSMAFKASVPLELSTGLLTVLFCVNIYLKRKKL